MVEAATPVIKLLIVDDQALVREGMASLLSLEDGLQVVGQAAHGEEALALAEKLNPDVVLMDIRMPVCDGVTATRQLHAKFPGMKILILTTFDEDDYIVQALQAGASGYLLKDTPSDQVASAIQAVSKGHTMLGPTVTPKVISHLAGAKSASKKAEIATIFTEREIDVLRLIGQGKSNREIGAILNITEGTVKNHVTRILSQIGARDRTQAALWAQQNLSQEN